MSRVVSIEYINIAGERNAVDCKYPRNLHLHQSGVPKKTPEERHRKRNQKYLNKAHVIQYQNRDRKRTPQARVPELLFAKRHQICAKL